ncbi:aspartate--ammonia ligase [Mycoplasma corogypsi]|uniref:aspartate--ammonia ligase n=1 Tax=Mycoplasma corogypsi TaxID=2106 RepID=UPI00387300B1
MYIPKLSVRQTQSAIQDLKNLFQANLRKNLNLTCATAPLFVSKASGLNDGLCGEAPVWFLPLNSDERLEVVHSLAKWKRDALQKYHFAPYEGLYTDMNAIRREETLDATHSYYVDQWDWEKVILDKDRHLRFLFDSAQRIYKSIVDTQKQLHELYPSLTTKLPEELHFIKSQDLEDRYPNLSIDEREYLAAKEYGAIFIYEIGYPLKSGIAHSKRAFDYDDWKLNGDLIVYSEANDRAIELSSMGIRVDATSIVEQSGLTKDEVEKLSPYHKQIVNNELPLTIGGGIGQSRVSMVLLEKQHIGEVQASYWPEEYREELRKEGIELL